MKSGTHTAARLAELMDKAASLALTYLRNNQIYATTVAELGMRLHNMSPPLFAKNVEQWATFTGLITGGDANVE